jgi:hypothetical protein
MPQRCWRTLPAPHTCSRCSAWSSPWYPGTTGTLALDISPLASDLSPMAWMAAAGGPTKAMPRSSQALAKPAFSDRKP